jgi:hypothetical protein
MKELIVVVIAVIVLLVGCSQSTDTGNPEWVDKLISQYESEPVGNPPQSIWSYEYNGQVVYFVPAQCCDMFSSLFDASGNVICAPDGGLTGKGDGQCPDFSSQRTNEQLVWKDSRTR